MYNRAKGIAVTEGIVASGGEVGKDAYGFLREAVAKALSSPAARAALGRCGNFMEFEKGTREALRCAGYVEANRARMRYPEFRAAGLPVGSGVVESACGAVAGRLKRGGMRWSVENGANPMLALRCRWLDGRHDEFFKARARPPPLALAA